MAAIAALADFMDATLQSVERRVAPAPANQFIVSAILDQAPMVERQDAVGEANRGQAVGDDENRTSFGDLRHVLLDDPLAFIVERARGLVEDQDPRLAQQCASNRDALALAAGQAAATFADDRVVALRQFQDEVMSAGERGRGDHALDRHAGLGQRDIVADRAVEQNVFLQHDAQLAAQPRAVHHGEIDAVDEHPSALGDVEALDELGERALSRAGGADNANNLAGRNVETDVVQHLRPIDAIAKRDVLEHDVAADRRQRGAAGTEGRLGRRIEDVAKPRHREAGLMEILPHLRKAQHRCAHPSCKDIKCHQLADGERAINHQLGAEIKDPGGDQLADQLDGLARGVAQADDPEARGDVAGELLFPAALHLRLDGHRLERLNAGYALDQKGLVLGATRELLVEPLAEKRRRSQRDADVERERRQARLKVSSGE